MSTAGSKNTPTVQQSSPGARTRGGQQLEMGQWEMIFGGPLEVADSLRCIAAVCCAAALSTHAPGSEYLKGAWPSRGSSREERERNTQQQRSHRTSEKQRHMPHPLRMSQSLPAALLSLAYITASRTTAFVLAPSRSSLVTSSTARRALLPATAHRRATTTLSRQQQRLSPGSTRFAAAPPTPARSSSRSGTGGGGGVRSLKCVAVPAGLEKGVSGGLEELLHPRNGVNERFVFFGGKGGVGKTSTSAAVAIQCADAGLR